MFTQYQTLTVKKIKEKKEIKSRPLREQVLLKMDFSLWLAANDNQRIAMKRRCG